MVGHYKRNYLIYRIQQFFMEKEIHWLKFLEHAFPPYKLSEISIHAIKILTFFNS